MSFQKLNNLIGWAIFGIALTVYTLSAEETASFWDCGEFIAVSYKLMVPHPPGAPFFLLLGRMFSFLAFGNTEMVAFWINMISVLSSAFTILFLYWSIVFLARKLVSGAEEPGSTQIAVFGSAVIGALAYTFSDSFWFSAVEAEVYGMSSFFTAIVIWATLKWEHIEDEAASNRWLLFIAYMIGLSIGVHLLNLLAVPALAFVYYFKRYQNVTRQGILLTLAAGGFIVVLVTYGVIPGLPTLAGKFEILFVNGFGMPFGSGMVFFSLLFLAGLVGGIMFTIKRNMPMLNTVLLGFSFILIGYMSYGIIPIRSADNTPIDENNPENVMTFVSYLKREQYGDRPLIFGRTFTAERTETTQGEAVYRKGEEKYEVVDYKVNVEYDKQNQLLFPRIYSTQDNHIQLYREWLGLKPNQKPTQGDNIRFFFKYQLGHMYLRYFMWNFSGRGGDEKEAGWLSPFSPTELPAELEMNDAYDNFYMLPLILGLIGMIFQFSSSKRSFSIVAFLFMSMGPLLVFYLNSPPVEPRERDYVYVGSFYAFAMWIGLGVLAIWEFLRTKTNGNIAALAAILICASAPAIMAVKGWDNHNRTGRFLSVDQARNALASCEQNAILFTGGDNDTFPLWYVQDVEGFRTDVRVVVLSYLSTDWYIDQMKRQSYDSPPLPISLSKKNYIMGTNDYIPVVEQGAKGSKINLKTYMSFVEQGRNEIKVPLSDGSMTATFPARTLVLPVDKREVIKKGIVPEGKEGQIPDQIEISVKGGHCFKNDLMILDMIATSNWDRPIYFNNTSANTTNLELRQYLQMEGMAYRFLPVKAAFDGDTGEVNTKKMLENMKKFQFRGLQDPETYTDDEFRKFGSNYRNMFLRLAYALMGEGKRDEAMKVINECFEKIPDDTVPYSFYMPRYVDLLYLLDEDEKAIELTELMGDRAEENLQFLIDNQLLNFNYSDLERRSLLVLQQLAGVHRRAEERASRKLQELNMQLSALKIQTSGAVETVETGDLPEGVTVDMLKNVAIPNGKTIDGLEKEISTLSKRQENFSKQATRFTESFDRLYGASQQRR